MNVRTLDEVRKLMGCAKRLHSIPSWPLHVADNLSTNLVQVLEVFIREMEEVTPFVLIHSWVRAGAVAVNKLYEAKGLSK